MSDDVVARAKAALEGVTPGPWTWSFPDRGDDELISETAITAYYDGRTDREGKTGYPTRVLSGCWHNDDTAGISASDADAAFVAASVVLVPELVAELEKHRAFVRRLHADPYRAVCPACSYLWHECTCGVLPEGEQP